MNINRPIATTFVVLTLCTWAGGCKPTVSVKETATDLRTMTADQVASRIQKHQSNDFVSVTLTADGPNRYQGTATTKDNKTLQLSVTVGAEDISYTIEGPDGISTGHIKDSTRTLEGKISRP